MDKEIARIRNIYETQYRYAPGDYSYPWHPRNPISYTYRHARERAIIRLLNRHNIQLEEVRILDVGCGDGDFLRFAATLGAAPRNLYGVDLMEYRIERARRLCPSEVHLSVGDAQYLPFGAETFHIVSQFTVFSSILDEGVQCNVAAEMERVLETEGLILWYDVINRYRPPSNIQGISLARLHDLFPGCIIIDQQFLHHRWMSRLAGRAWLLGEFIERCPGLPHTHLLALLKKP